MNYKQICMDRDYCIKVDDSDNSDIETYMVNSIFNNLDKPRKINIDQKCPICLAYYSTNKYSRQMPCGHIFHKACIDTIIKERGVKSACPMCKIDLKIKIRPNIYNVARTHFD